MVASAQGRVVRGLQALEVPGGVPRIALTSGEPAGIGPDLCLALARHELPCQLICLADPNLLAERARLLALEDLGLPPYIPGSNQLHTPGSLTVLNLSLIHI